VARSAGVVCRQRLPATRRYSRVETRLTLRPGQHGTRKLLERYGERLVRVRYLYDQQSGRRLKTVELIVESVAWQPRARHPRRRDDEIVAVRIAFNESDLRERAKRLGAVWRPAHRLWEIKWIDAKRLGISDRVVAPHL
jgi:hypothetical protein